MFGREVAQRDAELSANQLLAEILEGSLSLLLPAAQERVDDLEEQVFEEVGILLIDAGRHEQLPLARGAVLDRMQQMRLTGALVAQHRHHFRMRVRIVAIEIDNGVKQIAFRGEQFRHVIASTDLVVRIASEVVAEGIAGALQHFTAAVGQGAFGQRGVHP